MPYTSPRHSPATELPSKFANNFHVPHNVGPHNVGRIVTKRTHSTSALPTRARAQSLDSDDEDDGTQRRSPTTHTRMRTLDNVTVSQLQAAVSQIYVSKGPSPPGSPKSQTNLSLPDINFTRPHLSPENQLSTKFNGHVKAASVSALTPDKMFHHRLSSFSDIAVENPYEGDNFRAARMIRKKSGELVRSSLKPAFINGRPRPQSMPSTPVYSKNVHFDQKLEHIRHFLHSERPAAVSANTSPSQEHAGRSDFPFEYTSPGKSEPELIVELPNFVPEATQEGNDGALLKVETVYLSSDRRSLIGRVAVQNIAFEKYVTVRYTLDYWRTTSEVAADYTEDVRRKFRGDSLDRFNFVIKLHDFSGVENKTMFFCVRYNTAGQEFWDNNDGLNFRVEFHRRPPISPRKNSHPPMGPSLSTFAPKENDLDPVRGQPDPPAKIHLKSPRSLIFENTYDVTSDKVKSDEEEVNAAPIKRKDQSSDSFSNRYDFGASLTAAIAAANTMLQGSGNEITNKNRLQEYGNDFNPYFAVTSSTLNMQDVLPLHTKKMESTNVSHDYSPFGSGCVTPNVDGIPSLNSTSYSEILNNYCFFRPNGKPPPQKNSLLPALASPSTGPSQATAILSKPTAIPTHTRSTENSPYATPPYSSSPTKTSIDIPGISACSRASLGGASSNYYFPQLSESPNYHSGLVTPSIRI